MHASAPAGESVWRSPLVPPALAVTAGAFADRAFDLPFLAEVLAGAALLAAAFVCRARLGALYLLLALAALGAGYHQWRCRLVRDDEIGRLAQREPRPARLRGVVAEGPRRTRAPSAKRALHSHPAAPTASVVVAVTHLLEASGERGVSGSVRVVVAGKPGDDERSLLADLRPGDEVELSGRLVRIAGPSNPGEFDPSSFWAAQNVRALMRVRPGGIQRVREGWRTSPTAWFTIARDRCHDTFHEQLRDPPIEGLARALILGEGAPMTADDWAKYVRTGVVHVLAISGQHLVVVGYVVWAILSRLGVRQRRSAVFVALLLLGYALLTGGRPPALRAAVVCCAYCGAIVLRRPTLSANLFALGWIVVLLVNPASAFDAGCQLSFLAVAVLSWCVPRFFPEQPIDPLDALIDESRPRWLRFVRGIAKDVMKAYAINLIVCAISTPLAAYHSGLVAPAALLLGPPLTLLTSFAIVAGFLVLLLAPLGLAWLVSWPMTWLLLACDAMVDLAEAWPMHVHVGAVPAWWVALFYAGLFAAFTCPPLLTHWRRFAPAAVAWLILLLVLGAVPRPQRDLTITFLDVGHGGCAVVRTPDGRVILYDAGSMRGPDVATRVIAPYLWGEGIARIDDVVLSHPDLDHYNGLNDLMDRFAVGRVLMADSFDEQKTAGVAFTLNELKRRQIRVEKLAAGDRLTSGDVGIDVLHPPRGWAGQTKNEQSIVLQIRHNERTILLTGDLEGMGLAALLRQPSRQIDVIQAPHHGSARLDVEGLLRWSKPRLAVSCQAAPTGGRDGERYRSAGVDYWTTWRHGAITVRSGERGLRVSGHRSGVREWDAEE